MVVDLVGKEEGEAQAVPCPEEMHHPVGSRVTVLYSVTKLMTYLGRDR